MNPAGPPIAVGPRVYIGFLPLFQARLRQNGAGSRLGGARLAVSAIDSDIGQTFTADPAKPGTSRFD